MRQTSLPTRIGIVYTGGTFGMVDTPEGLAPAADLPARLSETLTDEPGPLPELIWLDHGWPPRASADLVPRYWYDLAACIAAARECSGFVVIHGTDTLAYTGAALSFLLEGLGRPVVVTGARAPLARAGSDARDNLIHALRVAARGRPVDVSIAFGGRLLRANRTSKRWGSPEHPFDSPCCPCLSDNATGPDHPTSPADPQSLPTASWCPVRVGLMTIFPGADAAAIRAFAEAYPDGLILGGYPAGVGPGADAELSDTIAQLVAGGTFIGAVADSRFGRVRMGTYASSTPLARAGVISGADMTREAALAKLHVGLCRDWDTTRLAAWFGQDVCGELTPVGNEF